MEISKTMASAVSGPRMMDQLKTMAKWVKLSGTAEELEAFRFVKAEMDALGFATELLSHDAYISLPGKARVVVNGRELKCITHSLALSSPTEGTRGRLVYLGAGSEEAYAKQDLRGCILLVEGMATPVHARRASDAGAVAQIHITSDHQLHEMCISPVWGSPSQDNKHLLPTTVAVTISREDGAHLRSLLDGDTAPEVTVFAEVDTGWRKTPILVAELRPQGLPADVPFVMFSGHIDTWYYGVMDNGTANVTMMEVARICAEQKDAWRRALRLCFWSGHSHGRYAGSSWYADAHFSELASRCIAHVNVDSTGGKGATVLTNSGSAAELRGLATEAISLHGHQEYAGRRVGRQGDQSFWGVGIPGMFGSMSHQPAPPDGSPYMHLGWWWHSPEDTLDKIDEANLVRDTKVFAHLLSRLLLSPVAPLDYTAYAGDLLTTLQQLKSETPAAFSLNELVNAAEQLNAAVQRLSQDLKNIKAEEALKYDRLLIKLARLLVPVDYTSGNRFDHDPALPQSAFPSLQAIRRLKGVTPDTDAWHFLATSAMRAQNRVLVALRDATELLTDRLS